MPTKEEFFTAQADRFYGALSIIAGFLEEIAGHLRTIAEKDTPVWDGDAIVEALETVANSADNGDLCKAVDSLEHSVRNLPAAQYRAQNQ